MAAHASQYAEYLTSLRQQYPIYHVVNKIEDARPYINSRQPVIITGERLAALPGRNRMKYFIPNNLHGDTFIFMFTRPIKPFLTDPQYQNVDLQIRGYANALDYHPNQYDIKMNEVPFVIYRIN
jgi:hypothetical protein